LETILPTAFRALEQRGIGILVSEQSQPTAASYWLKDPIEVERFLRTLMATDERACPKG